MQNAIRSNPSLVNRLAELQSAFQANGPAAAQLGVDATLYRTVQEQAALLSYVHVISSLWVACFLLVPLVLPMVRKNKPGGAAVGAHGGPSWAPGPHRRFLARSGATP